MGRLPVDENDLVLYLELPPGAVHGGLNQIVVEPAAAGGKMVDDIRIGQISLLRNDRRQSLSEATIMVHVRDVDAGPLPCRLTVLDQSGALHSIYAAPSSRHALRPGIFYSPNGDAKFQLPAGEYTITAGRGFEYSRETQSIRIEQGKSTTLQFELRRETPTLGYVACDPHVHTRTHSGHGDATVEERMITLAAEGIELPVATDHNVHIDHHPFAVEMGVRNYFTPVIGNEVTTRNGHFNVFPVRAGTPIPNYRLTNYAEILASIYQTDGVKVAILNHARDLHSGIRPFGTSRHNALVGENLEGWHLGFNAMEVINSSATQSQPLQLMHDWFGLLNAGKQITPVGSSDSHDVGRHFVGQGRTYIRCDDSDPGAIDVEQAVANFLQGRVLVSYGLLVDLEVNGKYRPGDIVRAPADQIQLKARVMGPHWASASRLLVFANGELLREWTISEATSPATGVLYEQSWDIPCPQHDVHLVAVAVGPGISDLSWPTAKPYQPTSPDWQPTTMACTGPIWLDVDRDGRATSARSYAERALAISDEDPGQVVSALARFDAAINSQAAFLLSSKGADLLSEPWQTALAHAAPAVRRGFQAYLTAWRENQLR